MKTPHARAAILLVGTSLTVLGLLAKAAEAGGFTVVDGQTATSTQALTTPGDAGKVKQGGSINLSGTAIDALINGGTVDNAGTINAGGAFSVGIAADSNITVTNSGSLNTTGNSSNGIAASGTYNTITNTGSINTSGQFGSGISVAGSSTVTNSGIIQANGLYGNGIVATVNNSVTNTGSIFAEGPQGRGIYAGSYNNVTNSGLISGTRAAVEFFGNYNTLNLQAGSRIVGSLTLNNSSNQLAIGPGLNTALTFTGGTIANNGVPVVVVGGVAYAVDVTGFAAPDALATDVTRAISGAVDNRLAAAGSDGGPATVMNGQKIQAAAAPGTSGAYWLSGLSAARSQAGSSLIAANNSLMGGFLIGFDRDLSDHVRAGAFAGYAAQGFSTLGDGTELSAQGVLAGAYLGLDKENTFLNLAVTGGRSNYASTRHINNNLITGGIETASASYGGYVISPSVTFGTTIPAAHGSFTPSLRVRYAGLFLDGYAETGPSSADLTVAARTYSIFDARAQLAYDMKSASSGSDGAFTTLRTGVDGAFASGGDVNTKLLGNTLNFSAANQTRLRGFAGLDFTKALSHGGSFTVTTELGYDTANTFSAQANAALTFAF